MIDRVIYESGNGGSRAIQNNTIATTESLYTMVYLKLFGGQVEVNPNPNPKTGQLNKGWWGNDINDDPTNWITSDTERVLRGATTTSTQLNEIRKAVERDLKSIEKYGEIDVFVTSQSKNRISIEITITQSETESDIQITWDATNNEVIENRIL